MQTFVRHEDEIQQTHRDKVKIVLFNIFLSENQHLIKIFGIAAIPTQVLLKMKGKEYFRHTGFYSTEELSQNYSNLKINGLKICI